MENIQLLALMILLPVLLINSGGGKKSIMKGKIKDTEVEIPTLFFEEE